jgi:chromate reductase
MKILGICGSLRRESFNFKLLKAFGEVIPSNVTLVIKTLHDIPLYNEDQEVIAIPPSVNQFADEILDAHVLLFSTPEYNYSIPGVLKNAIDWASRHPKKPFQKKNAAVMGASRGRLGTARAQYHLRQVAVFLDLCFLNRPELMVSEAHTKFDDTGRLTDDKTREMLGKLALALEGVRNK